MVHIVSYVAHWSIKDKLTMAESFPGDYCPFGIDVVALIEWCGVVQSFGISRKPISHTCYASDNGPLPVE